jgi:hypothetical protein
MLPLLLGASRIDDSVVRAYQLHRPEVRTALMQLSNPFKQPFQLDCVSSALFC